MCEKDTRYACGQTSEMTCNVVDNCMVHKLQLEEKDIPGAKLVKDLSECYLEELKRWLECRGQKKCGKKVKLVEWVLGCLRLTIPLDPKVDNGVWYQQKLETIKSESLQSNVTVLKDGWRKFPSRNLPMNFNYGHVYHCLIESVSDVYADVSVTKESDDEDECSASQGTVTSKPLKRGVYLWKSGFLHDSQDNMDTNGQYYIIRAHVHHSMKAQSPLNAEVYISNINGYVKSSKCDCKLALSFSCFILFFLFSGQSPLHYTWLAT